ncbi:MAG: NosD domain-containing protein, partial [Planctomycetota bacterium]
IGVNITASDPDEQYGIYYDGTATYNNFSGGRVESIDYSMLLYNTGVHNNTIEYSYIQSYETNRPTVYLYQADDNQFFYNVINSSKNDGYSAVLLHTSADRNVFVGNNMSVNRTGFDADNGAVVYLHISSGSTFTGNSFDNPYNPSFYVTPSGTEAFYNHTFVDNTGDGLPALYFGPDDARSSYSHSEASQLWIAKDGFVVDNVTIDDSDGVWFVHVDGAVLNNSFTNTSQYDLPGILFYYSDENLVENSVVISSGYSADGLYFEEQSDNNTIRDVSITTNNDYAQGVWFDSADYNTLIGVNITILDKDESWGIYYDGTATYNNFSGGRIESIDYSILLYNTGVHNNTIEYSDLRSYEASRPTVYLYQADDNKFYYNVINQSKNDGYSAVRLHTSADRNVFVGNNFSSNRTGYNEAEGSVVYFYNSQGSTFTDNSFDSDAQLSFYVQPSGTEAFYNHTFVNNTGDGLPALYFGPDDLRDSYENSSVDSLWIAKDTFVVDNVTIDDSDGVWFAHVDGAVITNSFINSSTYDVEGVIFYYADDSVVAYSEIVTSGYNSEGIYIEEQSDNNIIDNVSITTNNDYSHGVYLNGADSNTLIGLNISVLDKDEAFGVAFDGTATYNNFSGGRIESIDYAMRLYDTNVDFNVIEYSHLRSYETSRQTVYIYRADDNQFFYNVINQSKYDGHSAVILTTDADRNVFVGNNFSSNRTALSEWDGAVVSMTSSQG